MNTRSVWMALVVAGGFQSCVTPPKTTAPGPDGATFHVAPQGDDTNPGTQAAPFATIERARDAIRELRKDNGLPAGGVSVVLTPGIYELSAPAVFTPEDSGTEECPIEYRAREKGTARIVAGKTVEGWELVTDSAELAQLAPAAHGKVYAADLRAQGITDYQGVNDLRAYHSDPGFELFFDDKPMTLARYPNEGVINITEVLDENGIAESGEINTAEGRFTCDDPHAMQWVGVKGAWLNGFWVRDWRNDRIPLGKVDPATNSLGFEPKPGRKYGVRRNMWFYAEDLLQELDSPGEWYLDRQRGVLYFWPPSPLTGATATVSIARNPIQLQHVSHVTFRGLLVEAGRGDAFTVEGGMNVRIVACTIRNMGKWAARVTGGIRHGVVGCDIYATGQGGIHLEGGDRKTLTPAGHYAENNHIHHTARWQPVYQQGITLYGVGNSATHNLIDNVPHIAIGFSYNDMTIEYNEIHSSVYMSNDAGAIYTSPPNETWSMRGHSIRYNYLHHIYGFRNKGCYCVYLDDCFSSADISGNIFYDVVNGILIGGGRDCRMTNNMFVGCRKRAFSVDARGLGWAKGVGVFATKELHELKHTEPPWSIKYPELVGILDDEPLAPKGNTLTRNLCWAGAWGVAHPRAKRDGAFENNLLETDPLFADALPGQFELRSESPAFGIGFEQIPFGKIGLYASPDRASWPVESPLRPIPPKEAKVVPPCNPTPIPVAAVRRRESPIAIDGKLSAAEWFGLDPAQGLKLEQGVHGEKVTYPSTAWLAWDDDALYVAFDNTVSTKTPMKRGDRWGSNDAVEVSICDPALGSKAMVLVVRGFTNGTVTASDEAGADEAVVKKLQAGVQYAAAIVAPDRWTAEMRIPFAALGIAPTPDTRFPTSLAVRKQGREAWILWHGPDNSTWYVEKAGRIHFAR
ncbi:MAG: hypothetical protein HN742_16270 [Lentisphaerae bacterium]|jgi:hypothetical protein|nr:hypothetical protein [Lentisphaerota bacterium]MBT4818987.1 hypothetical protein [Lentisphaerota bacterium]MBT5612178.1 hypothetical protein [Lentisphaerota bacterium]MBT7061105.1 hypothetical protein [Lentisphaerota bacterium]MBT7843434.1 hypothetical protein [Lentisphaerota bacterium]